MIYYLFILYLFYALNMILNEEQIQALYSSGSEAFSHKAVATVSNVTG